MANKVSGDFVADLGKRGTFGGFCEDSMQSLLEGMCNRVDYSLQD